MIFIIGGAFQGKSAYAKEHFGEEYRVVNGYHRIVREQLEKGLDPLEEARRFLPKNPDESEKLLVISDEIGYGLVPVDGFERNWREQSGRVNCYLAGQAKQVIRVVCGMGMRIK